MTFFLLIWDIRLSCGRLLLIKIGRNNYSRTYNFYALFLIKFGYFWQSWSLYKSDVL